MSDLSPARYVGGMLYICDRCGAETLNAPCQCDKPWLRLRATITTTTTHGSEATTYMVPLTVCARCHKPRTSNLHNIIGDGVWCECPHVVSSVFSRTPFAWECPRCHVINAPHVDRCACKEDA